MPNNVESIGIIAWGGIHRQKYDRKQEATVKRGLLAGQVGFVVSHVDRGVWLSFDNVLMLASHDEVHYISGN